MGIASDFVLIVVAGLVGGIAARWLRLPLLVGYVMAGVAVGPHTAGPTVVNIEDVELLAEIGVALLLFSLGLEVSFRDLRAVRYVALVGGPIQILVTAAFGAWVASRVTGMASGDALWFGAMVSVSSTMVVLKTLAVDGTQSTLASRVMIGLLVLQDLAVVPMLIVLPQMGRGGDVVGQTLQASAVAGAFLMAMVVIGTRVLPALLRRLVRWGSRELFLVAVVAAGVGVGALAFQVGLSFAIGAFVAGIVLSESELSHQALSDVGPLRDVFGLLFFVTVGMLFDPRYLAQHAADVAIVVLAVVTGKAVVFGAITRAFGYAKLAPWIVGLGLSQVGEFSFVLARAGRAGDFITKDTYDLALTCTVVSIALSPLVFPGLLPLARAWSRWRQPKRPVVEIEAPSTTLENHVVVAGYGRTGRTVVDALQTSGVRYAVIDQEHATAWQALEQGIPAVWGDAEREDILRAAGIAQARMLVIAVPAWEALRLAIERARGVNPRLFVVARATTTGHVQDLQNLGVEAVVQPEFEGGIEMVRRALRQCDRTDEDIDRLTAALRKGLYDTRGGEV